MDALDTLKRHGVTLESMTDIGFALYVGEDGRQTLEKLKARFQELVRRNLKDPNIFLLIEAAAHLDQVVGSESGGVFRESKDPPALVADELIGMSIAEYIAGKKGLFNYVRYDKSKPGILAKLPPFLDDAVAALVAGSMTRLFEE
jgi:alpha-ribazole phosphatase CobZ